MLTGRWMPHDCLLRSHVIPCRPRPVAATSQAIGHDTGAILKISVIGSGYVGLVTGACLADSGNEVLCVDIDKAKIDLLLAGGVPIFEPGLAEMIARNRTNGLIDFTSDKKTGHRTRGRRVHRRSNSDERERAADLSHVYSAAEDIGIYMDRYKVVVDKSTVPVGTADEVRAIIRSKTDHDFDVVSNPEFLEAGKAVTDFMQPDRVVVGTDSQRALGYHARALRAVPPHLPSADRDRHPKRRDGEVRGKPLPCDQNLLHQRDPRTCAEGRRRYLGSTGGDRSRQAHWLRVPLPR